MIFRETSSLRWWNGRFWMIFSAYCFPMPGNAMSCSRVAVFKSRMDGCGAWAAAGPAGRETSANPASNSDHVRLITGAPCRRDMKLYFGIEVFAWGADRRIGGTADGMVERGYLIAGRFPSIRRSADPPDHI